MSAKRLIAFFSSDRPAAFGVKLAVLLPTLMLLSLAAWFEAVVVEPLILVNARLTYWLLLAVGLSVRRDGAFVISDRFSIEVVSGCTGVFVFLLLVAAVLSFPATWRSRGKAVLLGAALIFVLNQVRLVSLFVIGRSFPSLFEDAHIYVWQGVIIVITAFYWYSWAARAPRRGEARSDTL